MYTIILACLFSFATLPALTSMRDTVYIYAGPGASKKTMKLTEAAIGHFLKPRYQIKYILPEQLINDSWEIQTALLIIPGGADIPYAQALNGIGNQKIKSYVENGGSFLGICAGSYYAGKFVDFAKGTPLEVQGARELSFFPGTVRGPIFAPFNYQNESSARAVKITWKDIVGFQKNSTFVVYYNGGGYFVDAETKQQTTVLASYDVEEEFAAIIECRLGRGKVILSGVHFEKDADLLDSNDHYLQQIIPDLKAANPARLLLIQHLLERLNLVAQVCPL